MNKYAYLYSSILEALVKRAFDPMHPIDSAVSGAKDMYHNFREGAGHAMNAAGGFISGNTANVADEFNAAKNNAGGYYKGLGNLLAGGAETATLATPLGATVAGGLAVGHGVVDRITGTMQHKNVADLHPSTAPAKPAVPATAGGTAASLGLANAGGVKAIDATNTANAQANTASSLGLANAGSLKPATPAAPSVTAPAAPAVPASGFASIDGMQHPPAASTADNGITPERLAMFKKQTGTAFNPKSRADMESMARMDSTGKGTLSSAQYRALPQDQLVARKQQAGQRIYG